jgi:site-specific recombinase XerD
MSAGSSIGLRNRALVTVLYRSGLQHSEALALFEKDVDLKAGTVAVLHGKGERSRIVGIDPGACPVIGAWIERRHQLGFDASASLFCTMRGTSMKTSYPLPPPPCI